MNKLIPERDEKPADWLYAQALKYALLTAEEEQAIDQAKWGAVAKLQALMLADESGRRYLQHWAQNLLENPPNLESFDNREHYNLLKRDQVEFLKKGKRHTALVRFNKQLRSPPDGAADGAALAQLQLPGVLVTGLAEVLLNQPQPSEMAAALKYWGQFWTKPLCHKKTGARAGNARALRANLQHYYAARSKLVNHNLRLAYSIAGRINSRGLPYEDVVQGGMLGLIRAAEKYDHQLGYRFSTYAYNWINQSARQLVENTQGIVRYPAGINEQISRMYREQLHLFNTAGGEPSVNALAIQLQMEPEALQKLQQVKNQSVSLDTSLNESDEALPLAETLPESTFEPTAHNAETQSLNRCLMRILKVLTPVERQVVTLRWGLEQLPPLSRAEAADCMQVSTEWVRQLEASALAKLRQNTELMETYRDYFV